MGSGGPTTLSDEEVEYVEKQGNLYHITQIEGSEETVIIATTRPETLLEIPLLYSSEDERYQHLKGKKVIVPIVNRSIP